MTEITPEIVHDHGLTTDEYDLVVKHMGRTPNLTELGIFSVMWSEHCSYKSSRVWLKKLPTDGPHVIQGPGENAGIVDIGDGDAAIFKMESHNHPSYIEPYQGAATGVGGIMRDVFTMGARPVANMNALRFGAPDHPRTRYLVSGVVSGIGGYGNCMGVPSVGGEVNFHAGYNGNILVNAMTVGVARTDRIFYSAAAGIGNPVVYVGSKTGRDGIHGATMASAEFDDQSEEKRPTVQVGDPFTEKLLLEACLELMAGDAIVAIQDMGAAGLTSSSVEMASKGQVGIEIDLDHVPVRETGMTPYEMMLSESQERMLMVLKPGSEEDAAAIFRKWDLDFAVIGKITDTERLVLRHLGQIAADLPLGPLTEQAPSYKRPWTAPAPAPDVGALDLPAPDELPQLLLRLLSSPDLASRRWIWEQYDHSVMANTIQKPGGDAAVVRVGDTAKGLAITTDVTPRYCEADAFEGGKQAVAEAWRNLTAVGAQPLAITDCLNFGNPEPPEIMGQFARCIEGMAAACDALDFPVVSGNVSLYNETNGQAIPPTPAVGGVGVLKDIEVSTTIALKGAGSKLLVVGETAGHMGQSLFLREILNREEGSAPPVDLQTERSNGNFVRALIDDRMVLSCHDISDGGLLIALAEMAIAGNVGVTLEDITGAPLRWQDLFGEDQARYLIEISDQNMTEIEKRAAAEGVKIRQIGLTGGSELAITGFGSVSVDKMRTSQESWLPHFMAS